MFYIHSLLLQSISAVAMISEILNNFDPWKRNCVESNEVLDVLQSPDRSRNCSTFIYRTNAFRTNVVTG